MSGYHYVLQSAWHWPIAIYLFLGGLGAGMTALAVYLSRNNRAESNKMKAYSVLAGMIIVGIGAVILVVDLLQPLQSWRILLPWAPLLAPKAWIAWGTQIINLYFLFSLLSILPALKDTPLAFITKIIPLAGFVEKKQKFFDYGVYVFAFGVAFYTGILLASSAGVGLWHTPILPFLFVVSGFSTGAALLMIIWAMSKNENRVTALHRLEKIDFSLIALEISMVVFIGYYLLTFTGNSSARYSVEFLTNNSTFMGLFLIAGLIVPFILEFISVRSSKKDHSKAPNVAIVLIASVLVLVGGYMLRAYMLNAGFLQIPNIM
jgi:polysulfide reductase chain C